MFFNSWSDFLNMGGYGFYIWLSYGLSLLIITGLIVQSLRGKQSVFTEIRKEKQRITRMQKMRSKGNNL